MKSTCNAFVLWSCVFASGLVVPLGGVEDQTNSVAHIKKMLDLWGAEANEMVFYGKIVDQYNQPVPNAIVAANAPIPVGYMQDKARRCQVQSDVEGRFEVTKKTFGLGALKGSLISISSIEKDGYEYIHGTGVESFSYRKGYTNKHAPDPQSPVVFNMRKKEGATTFLIQERYLELRVDLSDSGKTCGRDLVQRGSIGNVANPVGDDAAHVADFQIKAMFNTNDATWAVVLSPGDTNGGIIVSARLLYDAPETGYQPEYTFTPEDRKPVKAKYVYLKSRDPAIYTRFEIEHINANKDFFRLSGKSVTNPYGDRNLEQATDLPYEVTKQLTDEAKTAFRQNKRPTKPDLPKLIKETRDKADKGKP